MLNQSRKTSPRMGPRAPWRAGRRQEQGSANPGSGGQTSPPGPGLRCCVCTCVAPVSVFGVSVTLRKLGETDLHHTPRWPAGQPTCSIPGECRGPFQVREAPDQGLDQGGLGRKGALLLPFAPAPPSWQRGRWPQGFCVESKWPSRFPSQCLAWAATGSWP